MSSVGRTILGAAFLLTGASAAMAQSANSQVAYQSPQAGTSAAPVAYATTGTTASTAPAAGQYQKPPPVSVSVADREDTYGGNSKESLSGTRAFWDSRNQY